MSKNNLSPEPSDSCYNAAIQLLMYEGQMLWNILTAYLVVNTILLGFIGQIVVSTNVKYCNFNIICFLFSFLGLVLVFPWMGTFLRNSEYYFFRMEQAKLVEPDSYKLLKDLGEKFSQGNEVIVNNSKIKLSIFSQIMKNKIAAKIIIYTFAIIYFVMIIVYGPWW